MEAALWVDSQRFNRLYLVTHQTVGYAEPLKPLEGPDESVARLIKQYARRVTHPYRRFGNEHESRAENQQMRDGIVAYWKRLEA